MTEDPNIQIDLNAEADSYFDATSESNGKKPVMEIVLGGPAVGKTTLRKLNRPGF